MINLLPQHEKKKLRKEFYQRYGVVMLAVVLICEASLFVSLIPSYLLLNSSVSDLTQKLDQKQKEILPGGDLAQNQLNAITSEISLLKQGGTIAETPPTQLLISLLAQKPDGVSVSRFSYLRTGAAVAIQLSGVGSTRESLLLFQKVLSNKAVNPHIVDAKYPQSFLLKKNEIDYLLTITLN